MPKNFLKKYAFILTTGVAMGSLAFLLAWQKILYFGADPVGEKECPPVFPENAEKVPSDLVLPPDLSKLLPWQQQGGYLNDASCLNQTSVYGVVKITTVEDIQKALQFAQEQKLHVSMAGVRHSMGGQAFARNGLILDMTGFNKITLNKEAKTVTVESGATWHDIQNVLHPTFAVKAMQSTDIFTVGGSISVNAHGMDHHAGSLGKTIRSMNVMLADGSIKKVSPSENSELFKLIVGGYGLFGVILDVELDIVENVPYAYHHAVIPVEEFPDLFESEIMTDKTGLFYGHLSTAPHNFMEEMLIHEYRHTDENVDEFPALAEASNVKLKRLILNLSKKGRWAKELKWWAEKNVDPLLVSCLTNRNQALKEGEACLVSRNEPMHDSVPYLRNNLKNDTDILQEYYIPREKFVEYVGEMKKVLSDNQANVLNISVRVVHQEDIMLNYAPSEMFAVVLYLNQTTDQAGNDRMKKVTHDLIELTDSMGGTFFLPYQLYYSDEQLHRAYPQAKSFFEAKKRFDPGTLFTNTFYEKYGRDLSKPL